MNIVIFIFVIFVMNKKLCFILVCIIGILFILSQVTSYYYENKISKIEKENRYDMDSILTISMNLQSEIKASSSFLLMYFAFLNPEHRANHLDLVKVINTEISELEKVVKSESQKKDLLRLKSSFKSFELSSVALLNLHDQEPEDFISGKYDTLTRALIDSTFTMMGLVSEISNIEIMNYALGINGVSNRIELTLASYYWGTSEYKNSYLEELDALYEKIYKYEELSLDSKEELSLIFSEMEEEYKQLDFFGGQIVELVDSGVERTPKDLEIIIPYVEMTNALMADSSGLVMKDFPKNTDYFLEVRMLERISMIVSIVFYSILLLFYFLFFIYFFGKKK